MNLICLTELNSHVIETIFIVTNLSFSSSKNIDKEHATLAFNELHSYPSMGHQQFDYSTIFSSFSLSASFFFSFFRFCSMKYIDYCQSMHEHRDMPFMISRVSKRMTEKLKARHLSPYLYDLISKMVECC